MPGSSFTNAPYGMMLTTSPLWRLLIGYLASMFCHGLGVLCFSDSAIFSFSRSMCRM